MLRRMGDAPTIPTAPARTASRWPAKWQAVLDRRGNRVGFLTPVLNVGGAERWMLTLARNSASTNWVGVVAVESAASRGIVDQFNAIMPVFAPYGPAGAWGGTCPAARAWRAVEQIAEHARAEALIAWGIGHLSALLPKTYRGRVIFVSHGSEGSRLEDSWTRRTIQAARPAVTDWVAVSTAAVRPFEGLVPLEHVTVLPNGIEPDRLRPARSREEVRAAWGFGPHDKVIGYVGRISVEKLPRAMFLAVARLPAQYKAVYVGDFTPNPEAAGPFREAAHAALGGRVRFFPATEAVGDIYPALDVHFSASPAEGFGLANLEALYCGCPLVAARTGILVDIARSHGVFWEEIAPGDRPEAHADAIRRCAEADAKILDRRARKAREVIETNYLARHQAARWEAYLAERLGRAV